MAAVRIHRLRLPLEFPAGLSPGESSDGNLLTVARDGLGRPVLRGTALAGALRQAWRHYAPTGGTAADDEVNVFGAVQADGDALLSPSALDIPDCVIGGAGNLRDRVDERSHIQINRHTGAVLDQGLFRVEAIPPLCTADVVLWLRADAALVPSARRHIATLAGIAGAGLVLGGHGSRGVGMARLCQAPEHKEYDLSDANQHAEYLDDHSLWRSGHADRMGAGSVIPISPLTVQDHLLAIDLELFIPRGQDFLVSSGRGTQTEMEPQKVTGVDGKEYWRLPGSTLRGLFRAWTSRLAAREGRPVAFSLRRYQEARAAKQRIKGDDVGWCFVEPMARKAGKSVEVTCPIALLFGSLAGRGRIHIADALALAAVAQCQRRKHVAIDRITGGAIEGMLFENDVLVGAAAASPRFHVRMLVQDPEEHEARWLAQCLSALDSGLIRVGSSKASGRLALVRAPMAHGRYEGILLAVQPTTKERATP